VILLDRPRVGEERPAVQYFFFFTPSTFFIELISSSPFNTKQFLFYKNILKTGSAFAIIFFNFNTFIPIG
jgi:hypothetical protein